MFCLPVRISRQVKESRIRLWHVEATPDLQARLPGEPRALLQLDAGDGDKRDNIGRADAGMNAFLASQVDEFGCLAHAAHGGLDHRRRIAGHGDHGAIVVGVH